MLPTLASLPNWLLDHANLVIVIAVVAGMAIFGIPDLLRFSIKRTWAISSVTFSESIRRKVLWITPLAIVGVMIIAQLQRPVDEQDAIRQTTKFCLFATGLIVVLVAILLACTSLPKEIENRVIFTIVTKPTTRLEIVLGKTLGFARVSAVILLIMGAFTSAYLEFRSWRLERDIQTRLDGGGLDPSVHASLQHYHDVGLLNAKTYATTSDLQFYSALPAIGATERAAGSGGTNSVIVPFDIKRELFDATKDPKVSVGLFVSGSIKVVPDPAAKKPAHPVTTAPTTAKVAGPTPLLSSTRPAGETDTPLLASFTLLDADRLVLAADQDMGPGHVVRLKEGDNDFTFPINNGALEKVFQYVQAASPRRIYVSVATSDPSYLYYFGEHAVSLTLGVQKADGVIDRTTLVPPTDPRQPGKPIAPIFRGGYSRYGEQVTGAVTPGPVGVYHFTGATPTNTNKPVDFEMKASIDRTGGDDSDETAAGTDVQVQVRNQSGALSDPVHIMPETNRTLYFSFPAATVSGGEFDLIVRCLTPQHDVALAADNCQMVVSDGSFYLNLLKSLLIFWLLTVLVVAVAIFCSVFVSWPIAVVLCCVILLGRWGVEQLGDTTHAGLGASVATDFGFRDEKEVRVISGSVDTLQSFLNALATVLPDINSFPATEDMERGVAVPGDKVLMALLECLAFGVPLLAIGYIRLKNKEVAP